MSEYIFGNPEVVEEEVDILLIGGGMACCGAAFEIMKWIDAAKAQGTDIKVRLVDKAALDRSGAVAQGLSAINTYLGENDPADYVRYVRGDLMGITREDLVYDVGRHVDDSVHNFEKWGLPIWKQPGYEGRSLVEGGKPVRSGRWQIMINGESYKWIVAEAAKKALGTENIQEHVFIVRLETDTNDPGRVAGAAGFSVREDKIHVYKFKACLLAAGGAVNVFRPRSVGEGTGRAWYPVWNSGSTYAMAAECGAELTLMENRFVPARFKDGYGPVGAWFLLFKAKAMNAFGEDYQEKNYDDLAVYGYDKYAVGFKMGTCLRNHLMMKEMKEGRGPIFIDTPTAMAKLAENMTPKEIKHLEAEAWEDFLDMTIGQCGVWAGENIEPDKEMSELMPTEPYLLGSHAGCAGLWVSGPPDLPGTPDHYHWGYNRMTTVRGLFTAGDGVGASGHKFSSGSHSEGRMAAKAMVKYVLDNPDIKPELSRSVEEIVA
jgi:adenylylsulfate reductase subunit A